MTSTLLRTAAPAWTPSSALVDALVLPAAQAGPAARDLSAVAAHGCAAAVTPMFRATNAPQGPPSRGTPV